MTIAALKTRRRPNAEVIDKFISTKLRDIRRARGMSQETLAEAVGLTFQQIQKYEKGTNRIASSTLVELAEALEVLPAALLPHPHHRPREIDQTATLVSGLNDALTSAPSDVRKQIYALVLRFVAHELDEAPLAPIKRGTRSADKQADERD